MTTTTNWEKEFDKKRPTMELTNSNGEGAINFFGYKYQELDEIHEVTDWGNIKNFIRSLLAQQREELLNQVVNMKKPLPNWADVEEHEQGIVPGYNKAISDVIELLSIKKKV